MRTFLYTATPRPGSKAADDDIPGITQANVRELASFLESLVHETWGQWIISAFDSEQQGSRVAIIPGDLWFSVFTSGALHRQRNLMGEKQ